MSKRIVSKSKNGKYVVKSKSKFSSPSVHTKTPTNTASHVPTPTLNKKAVINPALVPNPPDPRYNPPQFPASLVTPEKPVPPRPNPFAVKKGGQYQ